MRYRATLIALCAAGLLAGCGQRGPLTLPSRDGSATALPDPARPAVADPESQAAPDPESQAAPDPESPAEEEEAEPDNDNQ